MAPEIYNRIYVFLLGICLGAAQGILAFTFQVAVTGSLTGYLITMIFWCGGFLLGLCMTRLNNSPYPAFVLLLLCTVSGCLGMVHFQMEAVRVPVGALATMAAGFCAGRLIALCDLWGLSADTIMAYENLGFVLAFCLSIIGLLWFGVMTVTIMITLAWLTTLAMLTQMKHLHGDERSS